MTLTGEENLIVMEYLAAKAASVPECGYIVPAPIVFDDVQSFWANLDPKVTKKEIETSEIAFTTVTMSRLPQKPEADGEPWIYYYNFHIFRRYTAKRADESAAADSFLRRTLKSYTLFLKAVLDLNTEFADEQPVTGLSPQRVVEAVAELGGDDDLIQENEAGRYLQTANGFSADVAITVTITFREC
jgi:hypothetical protein